MEKLLEQYYALPVTANPRDFLDGKGNWGLTESEYAEALKLAKQICA
jgi:hypothetical protein